MSMAILYEDNTVKKKYIKTETDNENKTIGQLRVSK